MTFNGKRAAVYARISKDMKHEAVGVANQEQDCRALAERLGYEVVEVFTDNDLSASTHSTKPRPAYRDMLRRANDGEFDAILAYSNSRLTRRVAEYLDLIELTNRRGVLIKTVVSGQHDLSTADGRAVALTVAVWDQAEAERTSERIRAQKQHARVNGRPLGGPVPIGWVKGDEPGTFLPDPKVAPVLAEAALKVARGESLTSIARWVADQGVRGRRRDYMRPANGADPHSWDELGPIISPTSLKSLLVRPANVGLQEHDGKTYPGRYPAIMDAEDYATCKALLQAKRGAAPGGRGRKHLLSGVAKCWCGAHMVGVNPEQYACSAQKKQAGRVMRGHAYRRVKPLDGYVREVVAQFLDRADNEQAVTDAKRKRTSRKALDATRERLADLEQRKRSLARLFAAGTIGEGQLVEGTAELDAAIREAEAALNVSGGSRTVARMMRAESPGRAFLAAPVDQQRTVIAELFRVEIEQGDGKGGRRFRTEEIHVLPKGAA